MQSQRVVVPTDEIKQILIADIALIVGFALVFSGGLSGAIANPKTFIDFLPVVAVGVTLSFVVHELMHKFFAQRYGAIAGFRTTTMGLVITVGSSIFGFLLGLPGATYIYASSFTRKENGIVSLAGPLTNLVIFFIFIALIVVLHPTSNGFIAQAIAFTIFINLWLAFINMLPVMPFDGAKVFQWNKPIYLAVMGTVLVLLFVFESSVLSIPTLLFILIFVYVISSFYRFVL